MDLLVNFLNRFNNFIWGVPLPILLIGTGLYLTYKLRFIQIRRLILAIKYTLFPHDEKDAEGDISSFQALMLAMSGTVGTGNIIGVSLAISMGGPGALFWMWLAGLIGMATKYSEAMLGVKYRIKDKHGRMSGGPMYIWEKGLNNRFMAIFYAICGCLSALTLSAMAQTNSMVDILRLKFRIHPFLAGISIAFIIAYIAYGGIKQNARMVTIVMPFVVSFFIIGSGIIILSHASLVPQAITTIFKSAFDFSSATGGILGSQIAAAINHGVRRGLFSNEAGNGTAPIAAATARTNAHCRQGLINMLDVFIDTHIINVLMGLLVVMSGAYEYVSTPMELVTISFSHSSSLASLGEITVTVCLIFFSFTTITAWLFYGEKCFSYLFGAHIKSYFKTLFIFSIVLGSVLQIDFILLIADAALALASIPSILSVLFLSSEVISDTHEYMSSGDI